MIKSILVVLKGKNPPLQTMPQVQSQIRWIVGFCPGHTSGPLLKGFDPLPSLACQKCNQFNIHWFQDMFLYLPIVGPSSFLVFSFQLNFFKTWKSPFWNFNRYLTVTPAGLPRWWASQNAGHPTKKWRRTMGFGGGRLWGPSWWWMISR